MRKLLEFFSDLLTIKFSTASEQESSTGTNFLFQVEPYIRNSSVPKSLKVILLLGFNKRKVYQILVASDELFQSAQVRVLLYLELNS